LKTALGDLAARHETLRTSFPDDSGEPYQQIAAQFSIQLHQEDLAGVGDEQLRARLGQLAAGPFNLATGPLWRGGFLRVSDEEHLLLGVFPHIHAGWRFLPGLFPEPARLFSPRRCARSSGPIRTAPGQQPR